MTTHTYQYAQKSNVMQILTALWHYLITPTLCYHLPIVKFENVFMTG